MLKRTLLSTAATLLIAGSALAQAPGAPAAGGDDKFTAPPSASDQKAPDAPTMAPTLMDKQKPAVGASTGEVLPVETASQIRAESLIGKKVVNASGEELGTVDDIVISKDGMVSGLVVKTGGIMGIGGKSVAVAWQDVGNVINAKSVTLPLSKDQLEKAPEFATKEDQSQSSALPRLPDPNK